MRNVCMHVLFRFPLSFTQGSAEIAEEVIWERTLLTTEDTLLPVSEEADSLEVLERNGCSCCHSSVRVQP
jgi:hypothetical protein